jgi:uncharacterized protein (DUF58 family)
MPPPIAVETNWARGASFLAIGAFGVIAGLLLLSPAAAGFGLGLVAACLAIRELLKTAIRHATVSRTAPRSASEGDRISVTIAIRNGSRIPLFSARLIDVFGPESLSPKTVEFSARLDRGRSAERTYFATCRHSRGIYPHGPMVLELTDPFEWFTVRRRVDTISEFKVYPKLRNTRLPERLFASLSEPEETRRTVKLAESDEFFAVRDYLPGDPLKRVHWPLSARRDYPVVREYLPSVQSEIVIFLDVSRQLRFAGARLGNFESTVRFTASLAARAVRAGFRVQLRCGSQGSFDVPPATGNSQYARIVETLVRVRTRTDDSFTATLTRRQQSIPWAATAVLVLHPYLVGDPAFAAAVQRLTRRGCRIACVVYGVRAEAQDEEGARRHAGYLARLAQCGAELWSESGAQLRRIRSVQRS